MIINNKVMPVKYLLILLFISFPYKVISQTSKIGIVFDADTTLVYQYVGVTIFSNKTNSLPLNVNVKEYITNKLQSYLSTKYYVDILNLPDSLKGINTSVFDTDIGKKLRNWTKSKEKEYDVIVFIRNLEIPAIMALVPENTGGLYTKLRNTYLYTTITFYAYKTTDAKLLEYYNQGGKFLYKLKKFKLPKDKKTFSPEALSFLEKEYEKYLDQRIKYFLAKTYILPDIK